jgi:hypothetical protein
VELCEIFVQLFVIAFFLLISRRKNTIMEKTENELSNIIMGCAIEVHRQLGPGLLESAYQ